MILAAQIFRTWAAGFVGTTARGRVAQAETLLTAGPYAYVRNPMYLGALIITTAFAAMSGLPYALLLPGQRMPLSTPASSHTRRRTCGSVSGENTRHTGRPCLISPVASGAAFRPSCRGCYDLSFIQWKGS